MEEDFTSSPERTDAWTDGLPEMEYRQLLSQWIGDAWDQLCSKPKMILNIFKGIGTKFHQKMRKAKNINH